jgi:hypothetical protein
MRRVRVAPALSFTLTLLLAAPAFAAPPPAPVKPYVTAERAVAALAPFLGDWETTDGGRLRYMRLAGLEGTDWIVMVEGAGHAAGAEPAGRHASPTLIGYLWSGYRVQEFPAQEELACPNRSSFVDATFDGKATLSWETCYLAVVNDYGYSARRRLMRVGDRLIKTDQTCHGRNPCEPEIRTEYTRVGGGDFGFRPEGAKRR